MIVPGNKLLLWTALLLPFAALGGAVPGTGGVAAALLAALLAAALVDAVIARNRVSAIGVSLPEPVRLSIDKEGSIPLEIHNRGSAVFPIEIGLPLPEEIRSEQEILNIVLPEDSSHSLAYWPCTPGARGSYLLGACFFQTVSPLGLWKARGSSTCRTELRVYPNLHKERKSMAAFFLNRGDFGLHTQRMIGQGRDFEKLRDYIPGDSYDDVHWKATAKRGKPVTKLYQVERTQEVYVLIDASRLSGKETASGPALERFIDSALVLGLAAEKQGDLFGLLTFSDRIRRFIRAGSGKAHYNSCRDALYTLTPEIATPDFDELCAFTRRRLRRRSLLMILTDLGDPMLADSFMRSIDLVCRRHLVIVWMLKQPGTAPLFAAPDADSLDMVYRNLGGHMTWHKLRELDKSLQRRGVKLLTADQEQLTTRLVTEYLNIKARQVL